MPHTADLEAETARLAARVAELEAQLAAGARLEHIQAVTPSVIYISDIERGHPVWVGGRVGSVLGYTAEDIIERGSELRGSLVHPEDLPKVAARLGELARRPDGDGADLELRARRKDGTYRWVLDRAAVFERNAEGRIIKTISAAVDIDERKRAEERRTMLISELNHRVKNTLAAVQSIARQTLRAERPVDQTLELFTARLVALGAAHDALILDNWDAASLGEIVERALRPFTAHGRISVTGPEARLNARAAPAMAMALHELATNAAKYGALSNEAGRVQLQWTIRETGDGGHADLEWREVGGPPVRAPASSGFGSRLIIQGLRADLGGEAQLIFDPDGVVCRIAAPLAAAPLKNPA